MYEENLPLDGGDLQDASSQPYTPSQSYVPSQLYGPSHSYAPFNIHDELFDLPGPYYTWSEGSPPRLRQCFEGLGQDAFRSTSNQGGDSQLVRISLRLGRFFSSLFLVLLCRPYSNTARDSYMNNVSRPPPSGAFFSIPLIEFRDYFGQAVTYFFHIFTDP
jgi:hypothetical protein